MLVGVPKEIKTHEYRVGLTPNSASELIAHGHQVVVEHNCAEGIGFTDEDYRAIGAKVVETAAEVFKCADMIVKVKEPQASEFSLLREGQILFTYLHLAPDPEQTKALLNSGCIAIAYETVTDAYGGLPLLSPMSQVAGRLAIQVGSHCLEKAQGGRGVLLGGVPGVSSGKVVVIGGGVVGVNSVRMAVGKEARVTVIDKSVSRLQELDAQFGGRIKTLYSTRATIEKAIMSADLVVGAVLVPGHAAPRLVGREILSKMHPGSVLVDVAIDQGGCFETSRPTTHQDPTYVVDGVVHYCVTNMPGAVPRTSSFALNNATLPFVLALANKNYSRALEEDLHLMAGLNVCEGKLTYQAVAINLNLNYTPAQEALRKVA